MHDMEAAEGETPMRVAQWAAACLLACPAVGAGLFVAGDQSVNSVTSAAARLTVKLFGVFEGMRMTPAETAETIALAAAFAAAGPTLATSLFRRGWRNALDSAASLYPAWLAVIVAPAIAIEQFGPMLGAGLFGPRLSYGFMTTFSAGATAVALAYALWIRLHPETYRLRDPRAA